MDAETDQLIQWLMCRGYYPVRVGPEGKWIYGRPAVEMEMDFLPHYYGSHVALMGMACKLAYDHPIRPKTRAEVEFVCGHHTLAPCGPPDDCQIPNGVFDSDHSQPIHAEPAS